MEGQWARLVEADTVQVELLQALLAGRPLSQALAAGLIEPVQAAVAVLVDWRLRRVVAETALPEMHQAQSVVLPQALVAGCTELKQGAVAVLAGRRAPLVAGCTELVLEAVAVTVE